MGCSCICTLARVLSCDLCAGGVAQTLFLLTLSYCSWLHPQWILHEQQLSSGDRQQYRQLSATSQTLHTWSSTVTTINSALQNTWPSCVSWSLRCLMNTAVFCILLTHHGAVEHNSNSFELNYAKLNWLQFLILIYYYLQRYYWTASCEFHDPTFLELDPH